MLILTQQRGHEIFIRVPPSTTEQAIRLVTVDVRTDKVRLGFDCGMHIEVVRADAKDQCGTRRAP
jgi:sRNA-binding carbon storage regulator CsrA